MPKLTTSELLYRWFPPRGESGPWQIDRRALAELSEYVVTTPRGVCTFPLDADPTVTLGRAGRMINSNLPCGHSVLLHPDGSALYSDLLRTLVVSNNLGAYLARHQSGRRDTSWLLKGWFGTPIAEKEAGPWELAYRETDAATFGQAHFVYVVKALYLWISDVASTTHIVATTRCAVNAFLRRVKGPGHRVWLENDGRVFLRSEGRETQVTNLGAFLCEVDQVFTESLLAQEAQKQQVYETALGRYGAQQGKELDPYKEHALKLDKLHVEYATHSTISAIRRDHIEQLKRELDRKLVVMVGADDCWDGEV